MNVVAVDMAQRARDRVADGWVQGMLESADGRVCAWGAIECAFDDIVAPAIIDYVIVTDALKKNITILRNRVLDGQDIPAWNDVNGRTQEEVLAAFDQLIEILEGEKY